MSRAVEPQKSAGNETLWLIRNASGRIEGPLPFSKLKAMMAEGRLPPDSEICPENSYWFTFQEFDEMKRHFTAEEISGVVARFRRDAGAVEDATKPDLSSSLERDEPASVRRPRGLERAQLLGIIFFIGIVAALLAVLWIHHSLSGSASPRS
ncbi:MAG: hypothetical protein HYW49_08300 [Deltaproteobacteria bacterium]|nr:hypothetical protein [Deltaproteobacteria bacterium]